MFIIVFCKGLFRDHSNIIPLIHWPFVDPYITQIPLLGRTPPHHSIITLYQSSRIAFQHIFYAFYWILVYLLHKSQVFGVISIIVQPPPPYHSIITLGAIPLPHRLVRWYLNASLLISFSITILPLSIAMITIKNSLFMVSRILWPSEILFCEGRELQNHKAVLFWTINKTIHSFILFWCRVFKGIAWLSINHMLFFYIHFIVLGHRHLID